MDPLPAADFGRTRAGSTARLFSLANAAGFRADITDYGASLVRLLAPDREGRLGDVVLGFDSVEGYEGNPFFIGSTIGRFANRIAAGRFSLGGEAHQLSLNDGPPKARRHLHGGAIGFHRRLWLAESRAAKSGDFVRFSLHSPEGEEGYPGNLDVSVAYSVEASRNDLRLEFTATTDRATPVNFTNHAYFNLRGGGSGTILNHALKIDAATYTPIDAALIPRGPHAPVAGTPFDFRRFRTIGEQIGAADPQLSVAGGYDHNFVLSAGAGTFALAASAVEPESGRVLEVLTTEPGIQFYSGNFLDGTWPGKAGRNHGRRAGFCLETQHFPDSPNQPSYPSTILRPGEVFRSTTVFRFRTDR